MRKHRCDKMEASSQSILFILPCGKKLNYTVQVSSYAIDNSIMALLES